MSSEETITNCTTFISERSEEAESSTTSCSRSGSGSGSSSCCCDDQDTTFVTDDRGSPHEDEDSDTSGTLVWEGGETDGETTDLSSRSSIATSSCSCYSGELVSKDLVDLSNNETHETSGKNNDKVNLTVTRESVEDAPMITADVAQTVDESIVGGAVTPAPSDMDDSTIGGDPIVTSTPIMTPSILRKESSISSASMSTALEEPCIDVKLCNAEFTTNLAETFERLTDQKVNTHEGENEKTSAKESESDTTSISYSSFPPPPSPLRMDSVKSTKDNPPQLPAKLKPHLLNPNLSGEQEATFEKRRRSMRWLLCCADNCSRL